MSNNWSDWNWPFFNYDMKILAILWNGRCPWQNYLQGGECGSSCTHVKCQKFEGTILQPVCKLVSFSYLLQVLQPKCTKEMLVTVTVTADRILFCEEKNSRFIHNLQFEAASKWRGDFANHLAIISAIYLLIYHSLLSSLLLLFTILARKFAHFGEKVTIWKLPHGEKIEFQGEKSSFKLFDKIEFPSNRTKKSLNMYA